MRIENLELNGFKSFPDRTRVEFGKGISCVIGPNGSGKSNILDAIKWVIGEQSAKALRGGEMLDVIFAGSAKRSPVGFAEVTLTLTSEDSDPFPGEYARYTELQVGRRLHRSGASEYFINQTRCRRKDITELFLDTGVGSDLYCFIEQGSVGKIVHATPAERRTLIEEAAGISRYKARRHEAQQRLQATATQLDRAADVADEMGKRLRILEGQVVRAARYRQLRAVIRQQEILLALARYADLSTERRKLRKDQRDLQGRVDAAERELRRLAGQAHGRKEELEVVEEALATWRSEVAEQDARIRELEAGLVHLGRRQTELSEEAQRLKDDAAALRGSQDEAARNVREGEGILERLRRESTDADATLAEAQEHLEAMRVAASTERTALDAARHARASTQARVEALQARLVEARERLAAIPEQRRANTERAEAVAAERERAVEALAQARTARGARGEALEGCEARVREVETRDAALVASVRQATDAAARALAAVEVARTERAASLRQAEKRVDQADAEVQRIDDQARRQAREALDAARRRTEKAQQQARDGVHGAVREASGRARAWTDALEAAAGRERERVLADRRRALEQARSASEQAVHTASNVAAERLRAVESEQAAALQQRLHALETARTDAWARAEALRARVDRAREDRAAAELECLRLQGALDGLDERLAPEVPALARTPRLVDTLDAETRADPARLAALGDRLALPVLEDTDAVLALAATVGGRRVRVLLGGAHSRVLDGVALVGSLREALDHHLRTGGAAAVLGTGERVEADGVVSLGAPAPEAELTAERDRVRAELAQHQQRVEALGGELEQLEDLRAEAVRDAEEADALRSSGESEVRDAAQRAIDAERDAGRATIEAARAEGIVQVDDAREALSRAESDHRAELDDRLAAARRAGDEALESVRAEALDAAQRQVDLLQDQLLEEEQRVEAQAAQQRAAVRERAVEARAALQALRDHDGGVIALDEALRAARSAEIEARTARDAHANEVATAREAASEARVALARATAEVEVGQAALRTAESTAEAVASQRETIDAAEERARQEVAALDGELRALASADGPDLAAMEAALIAAEQAEAEARDTLSSVTITRATLVERIQGRERALADARLRQTELAERLAANEARAAEVVKSTLETTAGVDHAKADLGKARTERDQAWDRLQRERERQATLRQQVEALDTAIAEGTSRRDEATREVDATTLRLREVQLEVEQLRTRMDERYLLSLPGLLDRLDAQGHVTIETEESAREGLLVGRREIPGVVDLDITPSMLSDFDAIEQMVAELAEHRQALAALGEVNLAALEEYTDVHARHAALVEQREDLEESMARIRSAIAKMNRTSRQRFRDTYDRVAANIEQIYPRLTGGGTARLALTDEEDLLETGVEIFVQPPGKRLQNLTLLSGGEKAMTAIAMLFALFQVKPSPFCVLDEVDAPLDEANGGRFNEVVREMSALAQFILITHNRKTMEAADTLYGITMPTPGVSRLVSVRLEA